MDESILVSDLARQMGQGAPVILRTLWGLGQRGVTINHTIDVETAELVAAEHGYTVQNVSFQEDDLLAQTPAGTGDPRAPLVTLMGHVDHGKTSLLDRIRKTKVAAAEDGGITQQLGAYRVTAGSAELVFIDTPGHEAFGAMRARGSRLTDIVILVVAADAGVMPTTLEAIEHCKRCAVAMVVAINKTDKPDVDINRLKQELLAREVVGEEFGGDVPIVEVSAKTGRGMDDLIEALVLQAELLDLRAPTHGRATGTVLDARIDRGRGTVTIAIVQSGTLRKGDIVVVGECHGKVRGLDDETGKRLKTAGPSTPVELLGLSGAPQAGERLDVVASEADAKALVAHRQQQRQRSKGTGKVHNADTVRELLGRRSVPTLKVVVKAATQGAAGALAYALEQLSTKKVVVEVLKAEVGQINETDVGFAHAAAATLFGFNAKPAGQATKAALAEGVSVHNFSVIYAATAACTELMLTLVEPEHREQTLGEAEVRAMFTIPGQGVVAGCRVTKGRIVRNSRVRIVRGGQPLDAETATVTSLKVHKDDVAEVKDGFECGVIVEGFSAFEQGDILQAFELELIPPTL